jgi:predicted DNA-binding transcriptional regulator YafY
VIAQACRDGERLRFGYTARDGEAGERLVEPHTLVTLGRRWYLVAWDTHRGDWRTFRVDRLREPAVTGARFRPREVPGGDAAEYVRTKLAQVPRRYQVEVRFHAPAAQVERVLGYAGAVEALDEATCVFRMAVDTLDWPAAILGMVGADFDIVGPPELRDFVRDIGARLVAAGSTSG